MKKALIVASVPGFITSFEQNDIKILQELGYSVDIATNWSISNEYHKETLSNVDNIYNVEFSRSPFSSKTFKSYKILKKLFKNNKYDLVHCHTPVASILTRKAAKKYRKKGTRVIYTAHGFHFYKGASKLNWLIYYNLEKHFAKITDTLITINKEDFNIATSKFKCKNIVQIPGVGLDIDKFSNVQKKDNKLDEFNLNDNSFIILSVGELIERKNHQVVIAALEALQNPNIHYIVCGTGPLLQKNIQYSKELNVDKNVHFIGYRRDIAELCLSSNLFILPSIQEGLPVALMEAMSMGLPCIASNIRGSNELVINDKGGYLFDCMNCYELSDKIKAIYESNSSSEYGDFNKEHIKNFSLEKVDLLMKDIYQSKEQK